jgi:hypothetical protein
MQTPTSATTQQRSPPRKKPSRLPRTRLHSSGRPRKKPSRRVRAARHEQSMPGPKLWSSSSTRRFRQTDFRATACLSIVQLTSFNHFECSLCMPIIKCTKVFHTTEHDRTNVHSICAYLLPARYYRALAALTTICYLVSADSHKVFSTRELLQE